MRRCSDVLIRARCVSWCSCVTLRYLAGIIWGMTPNIPLQPFPSGATWLYIEQYLWAEILYIPKQ